MALERVPADIRREGGVARMAAVEVIEAVRAAVSIPVMAKCRIGHTAEARLLEALGVDVMCVQPFTADFSRVTHDEFVHDLLVQRLHVTSVVVGENFRYGHRAQGDIESLTAAGRRFGFSVEAASLEGTGDTTWSSTYVRACVDAGDIAAANAALAREHRVEGVVVRGDRRGREIGYPTANVEPLQWSAVPADGVYAGRLVHGTGADAPQLPAAISIGTNPTFAGRERRVEAFVLDAEPGLDLYGDHVGVAFTARLRDTLRFDRVEDLVAQMDQDVVRTREVLVAHPLG